MIHSLIEAQIYEGNFQVFKSPDILDSNIILATKWFENTFVGNPGL